MSMTQKKIRLDINATTDKCKREKLRKKRNKLLGDIHKQLAKEELAHIEELTKEIENSKNDSTRMFKAVRTLKSTKPKKKLIVEGEKGIAISEKQQVEIVSQHFQKIFHQEDQEKIQYIEPQEMRYPFSAKEVQDAANNLGNNKSAGCDELKAELIKHSPNIVFQEIADILNHMAKTGEHPTEIKQGILVPLPKPGKKQGPPQNLRPIILLSILRKILAIIMIRRTAEKLNDSIPITQAAYRSGRSTTEHVFTLKLLAEKAITSSNYEIHILLLDMSRAFDTVRRADLMKDLEEVLEKDELHMFDLLLRDVKIKVRCGKTSGEYFKTNIGTPQGDCASAILFTLYLAKSIKEAKPPNPPHLIDHTYNKTNPESEITPQHLHDHNYHKPNPARKLNIDQQYADDIGWVTTSKEIRSYIKDNIPPKLKKRNLNVNLEKTEEFTVSRTGNDEWKKSKYLGSHLDTDRDIKRRQKI
jgi:hypothetical protein